MNGESFSRSALSWLRTRPGRSVPPRPVALMIRPEQVYVDLTHAEGVRGCVEEVSYYGHDCAVQVRLDDGTSVLARMAGVRHPVAGDTVHLRVTGLVRAYRPAGAP